MNAVATETPRTILMTMPEVCNQLRVSKATGFRLVKRGDVRSVKIGDRRLVLAVDLERYIARLAGEAA